MLELCGMPLLPGPLWPREVAPDRCILQPQLIVRQKQEMPSESLTQSELIKEKESRSGIKRYMGQGKNNGAGFVLYNITLLVNSLNDSQCLQLEFLLVSQYWCVCE